MKKSLRRGQGMTEFIIIVALIAIGTIGVATAFGDQIRQLFGHSSDGLAGDTNISTVQVKGGDPKKNLSNFAGAEEGGGMRNMSAQ